MIARDADLAASDGAKRVAPAGLFALALVCGIIPAIAGILCVVGFAVTKNAAFVLLGFVALIGGGAMAFVAIISVGIYLAKASHATEDRERSVRRGRILLAGTILNIPLAIVCVFAGTQVDTPRVTFAITNAGTRAVESGEIRIAGDSYTFGRIEPGGGVTEIYRVRISGPMLFSAKRADKTISADLAQFLNKGTVVGGTVWILEIGDDKVERK